DVFAGKKSAQIREILISESAWEEMTCLFAPSLAVRDCGIYSNFFSSSAMRNIGNKSFSIYLFHWFFLTEMSKLYPNNALAMAASILMSTLAGWLIFALIEKPIENYRHRLQKSLIR
ncbi:MAG: hypothetical protein E6661_22640, partial [Enterobacter sp.]|uniref:acyltransferase family protein n=1 Tax=Enterobacter sp. TaxID=42895 RepID=UPI00290EB6D1